MFGSDFDPFAKLTEEDIDMNNWDDPISVEQWALTSPEVALLTSSVASVMLGRPGTREVIRSDAVVDLGEYR